MNNERDSLDRMPGIGGTCADDNVRRGSQPQCECGGGTSPRHRGWECQACGQFYPEEALPEFDVKLEAKVTYGKLRVMTPEEVEAAGGIDDNKLDSVPGLPGVSMSKLVNSPPAQTVQMLCDTVKKLDKKARRYHDTIINFIIRLGFDPDEVKKECEEQPTTDMSLVLMRLVERRDKQREEAQAD